MQQLEALWPVARLELWLDYIRELETVDSDVIFNCFDIDWEPMPENTPIFNSTLNGSFYDYLNYSNHSLNRSNIENGVLQTPSSASAVYSDTKENDFRQLASLYCNNIQRDVGHLMKLCQNMTMECNNSQNVSKMQDLEAAKGMQAHVMELSTTLCRIKPYLSSLTGETKDESQ